MRGRAVKDSRARFRISCYDAAVAGLRRATGWRRRGELHDLDTRWCSLLQQDADRPGFEVGRGDVSPAVSKHHDHRAPSAEDEVLPAVPVHVVKHGLPWPSPDVQRRTSGLEAALPVAQKCRHQRDVIVANDGVERLVAVEIAQHRERPRTGPCRRRATRKHRGCRGRSRPGRAFRPGRGRLPRPGVAETRPEAAIPGRVRSRRGRSRGGSKRCSSRRRSARGPASRLRSGRRW